MKRAIRFSELIRRRRRLLLFLLGALALAQWRCGENPLQPDVRGPDEVWISSSGFDPATLTVAVGTTVTWTNNDGEPHTVTSSAKLFSSSGLEEGEGFSYTFASPGTYTYYCQLHPHMTGTIVVK